MNAGTTLNVFPNEAIMEGSIRYFKSEVIDIFAARIESIA
jgi:metal-dependent amidase/aminoacylase/carboxypeptidase family protein